MREKLHRSRVTNANALFLEQVDGRCVAARRYRDLFNSFMSDMGGREVASEAQIQLARRCAAMSCEAEQFEVCMVAGDEIDLDQYLKLVGTLSRALSRLGIERRPKEVEDLDAFLARKKGKRKGIV